MDVIGTEIGLKMRSAIKAKLTELGCYVDDELPDYVMVMVANKRTRSQMEDDLQLFLGDYTVAFVNWLHQVLRKLQEVTVTPSPQPAQNIQIAETVTVTAPAAKATSKDRKSKEKKTKSKHKSDSKKAKKKDKEKRHRKKSEKKLHKHKKKNKSKEPEMIRPNIPPLLMNPEKESEPSITDVFAGKILKNHGVSDPEVEMKKPVLPIIDPTTITLSTSENASTVDTAAASTSQIIVPDLLKSSLPSTREEQLKELNLIEARLQKENVPLGIESDDEDFLTIRTEAEEFVDEFADEDTPTSRNFPVDSQKSNSSKSLSPTGNLEKPSFYSNDVLPQIELNLPKRPLREKLADPVPIKVENNDQETTEKKHKSKKSSKKRREKVPDSPERYTPEKEPAVKVLKKSLKSRLGEPVNCQAATSETQNSQSSKLESTAMKQSSNSTERSCPVSVVQIRARPQPRPGSNLLLRAVADAEKSLIGAPSKCETGLKRVLTSSSRRTIEKQKIIVQIPACSTSMHQKQPAVQPEKVTKQIIKIENCYEITTPSYTKEDLENLPVKVVANVDSDDTDRSKIAYVDIDSTEIEEPIAIHNTNSNGKSTTFVVTLDGLNPNVFLAKKLQTEGIADDEEICQILKSKRPQLSSNTTQKEVHEDHLQFSPSNVDKKRLSDTSEDSDTQVIIQNPDHYKIVEKALIHRSDSNEELTSREDDRIKKRKASPIVFDVEKKKLMREKTESTETHHIPSIATPSTSQYHAPKTQGPTCQERVNPCRAFPACRFGANCAFSHPPCKFGPGCIRRNCIYSHPSAPTSHIASQVVPVVNFKTITPVVSACMCKFYPNCSNPVCHYYHPKPCRFGKACANKLECNFYHYKN